MMAAAKWEAIEFRHPERSSKMIHLHLPGKQELEARCRGSVLFAVRQDDSGNLDWRMMAAAKWEAIEFRHPERSSKMIHLHLPGKQELEARLTLEKRQRSSWLPSQ